MGLLRFLLLRMDPLRLRFCTYLLRMDLLCLLRMDLLCLLHMRMRFCLCLVLLRLDPLRMRFCLCLDLLRLVLLRLVLAQQNPLSLFKKINYFGVFTLY